MPVEVFFPTSSNPPAGNGPLYAAANWNKPALSWFWCSAEAVLQKSGIAQQIRDFYPELSIFGCSTAGEICGTQVSDDSVNATAIHFEYTQLRTAQTSLDDFGTGYSSLALLQRLPLDTVKIDRSLMRDCVGTADDTGLADAIIAMGKSLSLTVVAQGVETKEQAEHLRLHACDELQGFYFKRPLPVAEFTQLLRDQATEITCIGRRPGAAVTF